MNLTWTGSDVLFAAQWPKVTKRSKYVYFIAMWLFAKLADMFVEKHIVVSDHLRDELEPLKLKKPIEVRGDPVIYKKKLKKKPHVGFNILYYRGKGSNQKFLDWVYGYDIVKEMQIHLPGANIIEVNGSADMTKVFPYIDFYVRPNRHDGNPRIIRECKIQEIPCYYSRSSPVLEDMLAMVRIAKDERKARIKRTRRSVRVIFEADRWFDLDNPEISYEENELILI